MAVAYLVLLPPRVPESDSTIKLKRQKLIDLVTLENLTFVKLTFDVVTLDSKNKKDVFSATKCHLSRCGKPPQPLTKFIRFGSFFF